MTFSKIFSALFLLAFTAISAHAQTADEVINKYLEVMGGTDKLKALKGITMEMSVNYGGMEIPVEVTQMKGGKMFVKIKIQGKEITQMAFDGETLWGMNMMTMKAEKSDAEATANFKLSANDFPDALLDYKNKGYSAEYAGKETKEGTECHKLKITKLPITVGGVKTDDVTFYYFETENNLLIATESEVKEGPSKGEKMTSTMSDYQEVDGFYFPYALNQFGQEMTVKKIILNPAVEDKAFTMPTE